MSWTNKIIISDFFTVPAAWRHLMPGTLGLAARSSIWSVLGGSSSPPAPDSNWVCKPGMLTLSSLTISDSGFKTQLVSLYYLSNTYLNWPGRKRRSGSVSYWTELSWIPRPPCFKTARRHGCHLLFQGNTLHLSVPLWPMRNFHLTFSSQKCKVRKQNLCII